MTDEQLAERLRAALPPTHDMGPPRSLWPSLVARLEATPRWSPLDFGLAAAVAASLAVRPDWLWLLVYHL
jgi:hypothetical protein